MIVTANGDPLELRAGATVQHAVTKIASDRTGVAVAVNDVVIARGSWRTTELQPGDRLEVLTAVQGG